MRRKTFLKLPDRYTGWLGEDCSRQEGRRFIKRMEHRAIRRASRRNIEEELQTKNQDIRLIYI